MLHHPFSIDSLVTPGTTSPAQQQQQQHGVPFSPRHSSPRREGPGPGVLSYGRLSPISPPAAALSPDSGLSSPTSPGISPGAHSRSSAHPAAEDPDSPCNREDGEAGQEAEREEGEGSGSRDPSEKPPHSYIALISQAILSSAERKLVLSDIYAHIMAAFPYYDNHDRAWRNSIRHNLSLNECFIKAGRADNGKGNYWAIHPACLEDFAKGDYRRRHARRRARGTPGAGYEAFTVGSLPLGLRYGMAAAAAAAYMPMPGSTPLLTPFSPLPPYLGPPGLPPQCTLPSPLPHSPLAAFPPPGAFPGGMTVDPSGGRLREPSSRGAGMEPDLPGLAPHLKVAAAAAAVGAGGVMQEAAAGSLHGRAAAGRLAPAAFRYSPYSLHSLW